MRCVIRPATAEDDGAILSLVRQTPQPGRVLLNFEREPSYFHGSSISCQQDDVWVARAANDNQVLAVVNIGRRQVYLNGTPVALRYAHDLRLAPQARGSRLLLRLFRELETVLAPGEWMSTVILRDNELSMTTVGSGRAGLPTYYPYGDITTHLLFAPPRGRQHGPRVTRATDADVPALREWLREQAPRRQFFPVYRFNALLAGSPYYRGLSLSDFFLAWRGRHLVGVAGCWNQKGFKQTRVLAYPTGLGWLRHAWNLNSRLRGGLRLPPAGGTLDYLMLHTLLVEDDDPAIVDALLRRMLEQRDVPALSTGFFDSDPAGEAVQGYRRQSLGSRHYLVSYDGDPRDQLDGRLPYVEVARL